MANKVYPAWKGHIGTHGIGGTATITGTLKAALVTSSYTYNDAHDFLDDVGANVVETEELENGAFTADVFDADDTLFEALSGDPVAALVIFLDTGTAGTSRLIAYIDTGVTGIPFTPSGSNLTIEWDNGSNKIFKL